MWRARRCLGAGNAPRRTGLEGPERNPMWRAVGPAAPASLPPGTAQGLAVELPLAQVKVPGREAGHGEAVRVVGLLGNVDRFLASRDAFREAPKLGKRPDEEAA